MKEGLTVGREVSRVIYLARHGETEWNRAGRWQGHTDIPLTELGRRQAAELGERLRDAGISHVLASDLSRARDTALIAARTMGLAHVREDPDLRERMFGSFEGLTRAQCEGDHPDAWAAYRAEPQKGPPGAESHAAVIERMQRALLRSASLPGRDAVLLVSHGGAMRLVGNAPPWAGSVGTEPIHNGDVLRIDVMDGALGRPSRLLFAHVPA